MMDQITIQLDVSELLPWACVVGGVAAYILAGAVMVALRVPQKWLSYPGEIDTVCEASGLVVITPFLMIFNLLFYTVAAPIMLPAWVAMKISKRKDR